MRLCCQSSYNNTALREVVGDWLVCIVIQMLSIGFVEASITIFLPCSVLFFLLLAPIGLSLVWV